MATKLTAPEGMSGLAAAPWSPEEIYAVAADWSQASCSVYYWGDDEWVESGRQVADYRHEPAAALRDHLADSARTGGGDGLDDDELDAIVGDAEDIS